MNIEVEALKTDNAAYLGIIKAIETDNLVPIQVKDVFRVKRWAFFAVKALLKLGSGGWLYVIGDDEKQREGGGGRWVDRE